ncbi:elongation factor G [Chitinivorax tropicus]|uniref:Elongation factor G n=1 Tax=Chitinivorax tropicus TaxID=714531 RepID=A0A840MMY2_9PROT|nr:elongation factor G [Chitinivorax tropicus]MBB5017866.1 elongation factor G [Chitinivorax tropicus]
MARNVEAIRSVALVGHFDVGKTTLAEMLLHRAGAIGGVGTVERGDTVCDFDPMEREYRHSLQASLVHFTHQQAAIEMIDTPGYPDFIGHAICALAAVDTALIVVNAVNGIELNTSRMMAWAAERKLCRMIIINKMDAERVDLPGLLAQLQAAFGKEVLPINLPAQSATAVVDCFFNPAGDADFSSVAEAHRALVDQVVEVDEALMATYLEQGDIAPEQLHAPFEQALREGHIIPVCFTSSRTGVGIDALLDVLVRLAPHPREGNPPLFLKGEGNAAQPFRATADPSGHVLAHVFKVVMDPFVGKMGVFRVHQGTISKDSQLFVGDGRKPFKVGHLFKVQGKHYVEVEQLIPGELGAVAKVEELVFDAVLHDSHDEDHIHLQPLTFPAPMFGLAIEPKRRGDEQRIAEVLHKLQQEDPCFQVEQLAHTHETVIRGLGELHMRVVLDKMTQQHRLEITTQPPRIPYCETITQAAEGHHRHKKQTGGAGQFGEVMLRVEPQPRGQGFVFVDEVKGGVIPGQFIPSVEKGVRSVLEGGPLSGCPVVDLKVTVYDGKHHSVDSKDIAFQMAGRKAMIDAIKAARPIVLEPVVRVEITCPEANLGDITADLTSRRGHVMGTQSQAQGMASIWGQVPLSELSNYPARLKSMTAGRGSYVMALAQYDAVPTEVQARLAHEYQHHANDEE